MMLSRIMASAAVIIAVLTQLKSVLLIATSFVNFCAVDMVFLVSERAMKLWPALLINIFLEVPENF